MFITLNKIIDNLTAYTSNLGGVLTLIGGISIATYFIMSCCLVYNKGLKDLHELRRCLGNKDLSVLCKLHYCLTQQIILS